MEVGEFVLSFGTKKKERKNTENFFFYFRFFLQAFFLPPVARLLCMESREIPTPRTETHVSDCELEREVDREAQRERH